MGKLIRALVKPLYATQPRFESRPTKSFFLLFPPLYLPFPSSIEYLCFVRVHHIKNGTQTLTHTNNIAAHFRNNPVRVQVGEHSHSLVMACCGSTSSCTWYVRVVARTKSVRNVHLSVLLTPQRRPKQSRTFVQRSGGIIKKLVPSLLPSTDSLAGVPIGIEHWQCSKSTKGQKHKLSRPQNLQLFNQ